MLDNDRYAGKKRKKPVPKQKPVIDATKSNPSKRHRDRLNGELDRLTNMLPFPEDVRSRLDKLSVLRLSVGYLKVKSFFNATMKKKSLEFPTGNGLDMNELDTMGLSEGELLLQALNGFVLVVTAEGYVFYASPTIQDYLGFHQSDMVHQSVFEFIHVEDRAIFRRQLHFALNLNLVDMDTEGEGMQSSSDITRNIVTYDPQHIPPENSSFLERAFVCRFRCLLDNSSGFLKLNFQGRLKFVHGQNMKAEDGTLVQPQLALFAIATPVQPPAIVEIRTKTILFQTKHKLDFTPLGIDSRGKVVLGYSEVELCMKGTGYQFIHAADMMYCADNHIRMIKTGESGMTVFRLLTKDGEWLWVQANARLVYKGGRPEFIIARQRALVNAEGEEHLRQRRLQLPFSLTTGVAILYDTFPSLDIMNPENTIKEPSIQNGINQNALDPSSILASMQIQDKTIYQRPPEAELNVDDAFKDSWALFNVPSNTVQEEAVKEEEDAVVSMIDALEQLAQDGDICSALQQIEVDSTGLKEWENALLRMASESSSNEKALSLDEILSNDIFSYVEDALYKEMNKDSFPKLKTPTAAKTNQFGGQSGHSGQYPAPMVNSGFTTGHSFGSRGIVKPDLNKLDFAMAKQETDSVLNAHGSALGNTKMGHGIAGYQEGTSLKNILNHLSQTDLFTFGSKELYTPAQKYLGQQTTSNTFSIIPTSGWEPQQTVQNGRKENIQTSTVPSCQFVPHPINQTPQMHHLQNGFHQSSQPTMHNGNKMVLGAENHSPFLSTYKNCVSSSVRSSCTHLPNFPQQSQMQPSQQLQQSLPEQPCPGLVPESYQNVEAAAFPLTHLLPQCSPSSSNECSNSPDNVYLSPVDRLATNHCSPRSSCMFESHSPLTNADQLHPQAQAVTITSCCKNATLNNQSPPQASCYFQWMPNEPVVGTSSIPQEDACISPPSCHMVADITPSNGQSIFQQYHGCNGQTQVVNPPVDHGSPFSIPPLTNGLYRSENSKTNCCNL
ncbi:aryl hydrocarbon receptor-like [Hoplias malabaricus]|uniref:aryl hydrocarbon receptor-like n=1 Tax=Hoplias malabaricus TaxID=27720 RepID=UPI00346242F9